mmetsp:Transcript_64746/g.146060  ORF Transcript_64746/g.146060 Transcript_64746/m.146060 type:complete len:142 (-) Transcript_64746:614-1039(-)
MLGVASALACAAMLLPKTQNTHQATGLRQCRREFFGTGPMALSLVSTGSFAASVAAKEGAGYTVDMSEEAWAEELNDQQFFVLRRAGTEPPFSSPLSKEMRDGDYRSVETRTTEYEVIFLRPCFFFFPAAQVCRLWGQSVQ